ncbi:hypothetical protein THAOC_24098 [Thalassiosira oceanica]|uniref:Uncharacterized protein n=1 Tax=Thalassiosira oceanica TaxID=159749 RepID=K0S582_THAOC|nr:hypothetical protein THAOC_24098 [Thalassiosira oceanica]|eukprot:EJK56081.1 hypothetical protein THAOC_24098 [Thalassiosira oceanica]
MHQTVGNILRTVLNSNPNPSLKTAKEIVDDALATAMHAMRTNVATTLGSSPGSLVFARDMFLNVHKDLLPLNLENRLKVRSLLIRSILMEM